MQQLAGTRYVFVSFSGWDVRSHCSFLNVQGGDEQHCCDASTAPWSVTRGMTVVGVFICFAEFVPLQS